jgi:hypothetical protein
MGIFPYTCELCGGGYQRCALSEIDEEHHDCEGGQFCYEEDVVILVNGKKFDGVYNGYGEVEVTDGTIYVPSEFAEYIDGWGTRLTYDRDTTRVEIYCQSCFHKQKFQ